MLSLCLRLQSDRAVLDRGLHVEETRRSLTDLLHEGCGLGLGDREHDLNRLIGELEEMRGMPVPVRADTFNARKSGRGGTA
jgi:hypothetical protein